LKLPAKRVDQLVAEGSGERLDPGSGKPMKKWLSLGPATDAQWLELAKESLEFVRGR
jgi:hypothetical protein